MRPPCATDDLPGAGGSCPAKARRCEELVAVPASGDARHWWIRVLKHGLGTAQARQAVARAARCGEDAVACAGHRDRHSIASQWFSVPAGPVEHPNQLRLAGAHGKMKVLEVVGAARPIGPEAVIALRWRLRIEQPGESAYLRAKAVMDRLRRQGLPNYVDPELVEPGLVRRGRQLLAGARVADPARAAWAVQAWLFNAACARRVDDGTWGSILAGDVVDAGGGLRIADDPAPWLARAEQLACHPCGPWFGPGMPPAGGAVAEAEAALLDEAGIGGLDRLGPGARRPYRVQPRQVQVQVEGDAVAIACELPPDTYVGTLLREVLKA